MLMEMYPHACFIQSLLLERPAPTGTPLSINRVRKNGCALLRFDFIYGDLVRWLEGEYTNCNVVYDTMFDNLDDLWTTQMPTGYPKVDLDQIRETMKDIAPTKGTFTSKFRHVRQRAQYNNHKCMHGHIYIMTDKFAKEEEKSYHLSPPPQLVPVLCPQHHGRALESDHAKTEVPDHCRSNQRDL
jgi:hypothetical protein